MKSTILQRLGALLILMSIMNVAIAEKDFKGNKVVFDLASAGIEPIGPPGSLDSVPNGKFFGTVAHGFGYLYQGYTIPACAIGDICGTNPNEFPNELLGTVQWGFVIDNPSFDTALNALFSGNLGAYVTASEALRGVEVFTMTFKLIFSGSADFITPGANTLLLEGKLKWGVSGETSLFNVIGGTGIYANAKHGTCKLERIIVLNAAGLESFRLTCPRSILVPK